MSLLGITPEASVNNVFRTDPELARPQHERWITTPGAPAHPG